MNSSRQQHVYGPLLVLASLMVVGMFLLPGHAEAGKKAKVTWEPETLEVTLFAGTSQVRELSFRTSGDVENVSFSVVPALEEFLFVESYGLETIQEGVEYTLIARFDIPAQTPLTTYNGTVHLREGKRTIAKPLKVIIHVAAPTNTEIPIDVSLPSQDRIVENENGIIVVRDELVIGLSSDTTHPETTIKELAALMGGVVIGSIPNARMYQIQFSVANLEELDSIRQIIQVMDYVDFISYHDFAAELTIGNPGKEFDDDWDETNPDGNNWGYEFIKAPTAWEEITGTKAIGGDPVRIAVIDSDIDGTHVDLLANVDVLAGAPYLGPWPLQPFSGIDLYVFGGHGTHVAGTVCADGHNDLGIAGVIWDCSLRLYNLFPGFDEDDRVYSYSLVHTLFMMQNAIDDGAQIINMSLSSEYSEPVCAEYLEWVDIDDKEKRQWLEQENGYAHIISEADDVLWVIAAGNSAIDARCSVPANLVDWYDDNVISVAAIYGNGFLWEYPILEFPTQIGMDGSNYGPSISVAAPGFDILSLLPGNRYGSKPGTSMAAPFVSGLAGLVLAKNPGFSAAKVKDCIVDAAETFGPAVPDSLFHDNDFHVIDAPHAVECESGLQRIQALGRSLSENGLYLAHDPGDQWIPEEDGNSHQDVYLFDLEDTIEVPRDHPVLVSANQDGNAGNDRSRLRADQPSVSNNGRVVFQSDASDLVLGDVNRTTDIFVRDSSDTPAETYLVSVDNNGNPNDSQLPAFNPSISTDGRYVAFESKHSFTSQPDSLITDIFLRDIKESKTFLVSKDRRNRGDGGNSSSFDSLVSPNGEFVVFTTRASNIGDGTSDTDDWTDVYLYDISENRVVERISVGKGNVQANGDSKHGNISRDGRFVFFYSTADGLEDGGGVHRANDYKLYLRDRQKQETILIDPIWNGYELRKSRIVRITEDGRYIAFWANQWTPGHSDIILWDTVDDDLIRLSQGYDPDDPEPSNGSSLNGFINNDTQVAFLSAASNLVPDDDNGEDVDLFIYTIPK